MPGAAMADPETPPAYAVAPRGSLPEYRTEAAAHGAAFLMGAAHPGADILLLQVIGTARHPATNIGE
jgi:hypothetical protein